MQHDLKNGNYNNNMTVNPLNITAHLLSVLRFRQNAKKDEVQSIALKIIPLYNFEPNELCSLRLLTFCVEVEAK